jgi:prophage antirepressor-like protein
MEISKIIDSTYTFEYVLVDTKPWFRSKPVAEALTYAKTDQVVRTHVHPDDKRAYADRL